MKLVCVSSSPVKKGNNEHLAVHMLEAARKLGCETELLNLSGMDIKPCVHCNGCIGKQKEGRYCLQKDDAQTIFNAVETCDILLLASPVYHMRMNAQMAAFADRMRVFIFGNISAGKMKNKIGISGAVAWKRHGGFETTHLSHMYMFYNLDMLPVGCHHSISPLGASAVSSRDGHGIFEKDVRLGTDLDKAGLKSGVMLVKRAVEVAGCMSGG